MADEAVVVEATEEKKGGFMRKLMKIAVIGGVIAAVVQVFKRRKGHDQGGQGNTDEQAVRDGDGSGRGEEGSSGAQGSSGDQGGSGEGGSHDGGQGNGGGNQ